MADPAGFSLPPEFQQALDEATRRQQIARMLTERSLNFQGPQQVGRVAARISPLASFANLAGGVAGGYLGNQANQDLTKVRQDYSNAEAADLSRIQGLPPAEGVQQGTISQFARSRELAKTLRDQEAKKREAAVGILKDIDPKAAMGVNYGTTDPQAYSPPPQQQPVVEWIPDPNNPGKQIPKTLNYDKTGLGKATLGTSGSTQTVNVGDKEELKYRRMSEQKDLEGMQTRARSALSTLATTEQIGNVLEQGASVGGGAGLKQTVRKALSVIGVDFPETGPTDQAKTLLGRALAEHAKTFGSQPTEAEDKRIAELVGTIDTDPNALPQILAWMNGTAYKSLQDFGTFVDLKRKGKTAQDFPDLYDTADVGIKQPTRFYGPLPVQLKSVEALRQAGGDITKLLDPDRQPFSPDATFNGIKLGPITPPSVAPTPQAARPEDAAKLKRIKELEKELGITR